MLPFHIYFCLECYDKLVTGGNKIQLLLDTGKRMLESVFFKFGV